METSAMCGDEIREAKAPLALKMEKGVTRSTSAGKLAAK